MPVSRNPSAAVPRSVTYEDCWAKTKGDGLPGIGVAQHCRNVGHVARALLGTMPAYLRRLLPEGAIAVAAAHDIGKVSPAFQAKCSAWLQGRDLGKFALLPADHAACTQYTLRRHVGDEWAQIVGAHHGRIKPPNAGLSEWNEERERLLIKLLEEFGPLPAEGAPESVLFLVGGLISVADWIGSDERFFPQVDDPEDAAASSSRAIAALDGIGWRALQPKIAAGFNDQFPNIAQPNSLQNATLESLQSAGLYIIEAPMGYGKTEAALAATHALVEAGAATGLYFALPTQTTSNRIVGRVRDWASNAMQRGSHVRLAHGTSWLAGDNYIPCPATQPVDGDIGSTDASWFASSKRALLSPLGVGTVDQALLGVIAVKHFFVRQFALAGKVVVLDEVHSYDIYTGTLITLLVRRLRELGATVIVLSATLIEERRRELLGIAPEVEVSRAYPLLSFINESGSLIEKSVEPPSAKTVAIRHLASSPFEEAISEARRGACILWIRNTVQLAQDTFDALNDRSENSVAIGLLHSRFPHFRRQELEEQWMEALGHGDNGRPQGCILVTTQIAEQSVDIDADLLITDLAPTDMLIQRLGRLFRHKRANRPVTQPEMWLEMLPLDNLGDHAKVYAPYVLARSSEQWKRRTSIVLPNDIRSILEATYAATQDDEPDLWAKWYRQLEEKKRELQRRAIAGTRVWQSAYLDDVEGVGTRWNDVETASLVLIRAREGNVWTFLDATRTDIPHRWDVEPARAIHRNLVRVPGWPFARSASPTLRPFLQGSSAIGLIDESGTIRVVEGEAEGRMVYDALRGVVIQANEPG